MKFILFLTFFYSTSSIAFIGKEAMGLIENQTLVNDDIIHNGAQEEIENDFVSANTLKLIEKNEQLKDDIVYLKIANKSKKDCDEDDESKKDPPFKKRKTKYKHKTEGQWVIGAVFEVKNDGNYEQYAELENTLDPNALNSMFFDWISAESFNDLKVLIKEQTKDMNKTEFLEYLSYMTGRLPYNDDKAAFSQAGDTQAPDDLWNMLQEQKQSWEGQEGFDAGAGDEWGGVCGDIHFAALMIGEIAKPEQYEYFTASYVLADSQHVYTFAVDKDTGQAIVVNYDDVQVVDNPDGIESFSVKNSSVQGGFNNVGTNVRIFANSDGNAEHVATLKSALGSFIYNATVEEHNQTGAPIYNDFQTSGVEGSSTKKIVKGKKVEKYDNNGNLTIEDKSKTYYITNGFKLLKGTRQNGNLDNTDIFTAVYFQKKTTNTDGFGNIQDPSKFGKESNFSISGIQTNIGNMKVNEDLYVVQLNYNYGLYKNILRTDKVDLQANGKMNINGDFYMIETTSSWNDNVGTGYSGDGNLETSIGLDAKIKLTDKDRIVAYTSYDQAIGVKKERQLYDWAYLPKNVKLTSAAIRSGATYSRTISPGQKLSLGANYVGTQVGGLYNISTSFQTGKTYVFVNYQNNAPGINRNISSNLLPNAGQRVSGGYGAKDVKFLGTTADFGTSITYLPNTKDYFVSGSMRVNLAGKKKNKSKSKVKLIDN